MAAEKGVPILDGDIAVAADTVPTNVHIEDLTLEDGPHSGDIESRHFDVDVLVVGAGFSGVTAIHRFRKLGLNVKCFEAAGSLGGVWYWNRYPGARVDSEMPFYQLSFPEVYRTWKFNERFPDHRELRKYFAHVEKVLDLKKDITYHARVNEATWDQDTGRWTIKTQQGHTASCKYFVLCVGGLHRTFTPEFAGMSDYKGEIYHSGAFPEDFSAKGKKVALIGAGATGVQITQELGKTADQLTVLLRRPTYCLPMVQRKYTESDHKLWQPFYSCLFAGAREGSSGFPHDPPNKATAEATAEEREAWYEELWNRGAFSFLTSNYSDLAFNKEANKIAYDFWKRQVRQRLTDPKKQAVMAPDTDKMPYYFGTKRTPLEQDYYEVLNQENVSIVDLKQRPLRSFSEHGLILDDGSEVEADTVIFATGFDSFTGALTHMGIRDRAGRELADHWKDGVHTYMGLMVSEFPNLMMCYSPQAPNALANGPTIIELQIDLIVDIIAKLEKEGAKTIEARPEAEAGWKAQIDYVANLTLLPTTDSWWNGANVPGKKSETLSYFGGNAQWEKQCRSLLPEWQGFEVKTTL